MDDKSGKENDLGRPEVTEEEKKAMVQKVEPYLKSGLSVRKALREAQIPRSTFYKLLDRDEEFRDQIDRFRQFLPIMFNNAVIGHLQNIMLKQNPAPGGVKVPLNKDDVDFLKWFATNSNLTKEEYGERKEIGIIDPEAELQRAKALIQEFSAPEEGEDDDEVSK